MLLRLGATTTGIALCLLAVAAGQARWQRQVGRNAGPRAVPLPVWRATRRTELTRQIEEEVALQERPGHRWPGDLRGRPGDLG